MYLNKCTKFRIIILYIFFFFPKIILFLERQNKKTLVSRFFFI